MTLTVKAGTLECGATFPAGGKARGLVLLARAGAATPPWRVIPADRAAGRPWDTEAGAVQELESLFRDLSVPPFQGVAVRSSARVEDGARASHAGQFATVFVDTPEAMPAAVNAVLDSGPEMAVLIQARVRAKMAGVLFSAHPSQALPGEAYAEVVLGLGKGLVDGLLEPSRFHLDLAARVVARAETGRDGPEVLEAPLVRALLEPLFRLEELTESPVDLEWAADDTGLWFLQVRPITALQLDSALRPPACATSWFFDQRFFEPIRPITQSTLLPLIARVSIADALAMRGHAAPAPLLRCYTGQAYVPHALYRAMLAGAPRWWLSPDLRQLFPEHCACGPARTERGSPWGYAYSALRSVAKHARDVFLNLPAWDHFRRELLERLAALPEASPESEGAWTRQWAELDGLSEGFLRIHRWSYLWANYAYRLVAALKRLFPEAMRRVEQQAARTTRGANTALARVLHGEGDLTAFREAYGHRSESLDYAAATWKELLDEGRLAAHYAGLKLPATPAPDQPPPRLFRPLARIFELREEQRFTWERVLARQRRMLRDAGRILRERGMLEEDGDVHFLAWEELIGALFGGRTVPALALRKHAWRLESRIPKPLFIGPEPEAPPEAAALLTGLCASPGRVQGRAFVAEHPRALAGTAGAGCIAVLTALDPAWTALMPRAAALVIERGGVLSHAAILAREYGVPMVIGVEGATQRLKTGMLLDVDASRGRIRILEQP